MNVAKETLYDVDTLRMVGCDIYPFLMDQVYLATWRTMSEIHMSQQLREFNRPDWLQGLRFDPS